MEIFLFCMKNFKNLKMVKSVSCCSAKDLVPSDLFWARKPISNHIKPLSRPNKVKIHLYLYPCHCKNR